MFENLSSQDQLPTFEDLVKTASSLVKNQATTQAFLLSKSPGSKPPPNIPAGSPWQAAAHEDVMDTEPAVNEAVDSVFDDMDLPLPGEADTDSVPGDTTLANTILFLRDAIWWREVCLAVAEGDTGRVLEMFKV